MLKEQKHDFSSESEENDFYISEIEKARRSLPIFFLRESLLETIRDN